MMNVKKLQQKGFTLIELMIVVAIIGILARIAIPSYTEYIKKGKLAEATSNLADMRVKMEQCYQDNRTYVGCSCVASTSKYFTFSCGSTQTATAYTITATGISSQNMGSYTLTVNEANVKTGW